MSERRTYSNKYDPEIIPVLAEKRAKAYSARSLPVNQYIEMLVLRDAGHKESLGEPVHDEAATLARIGSLITYAISALPPGSNQSTDLLNTAKHAIFERTQALQPTIAETQRTRSREAWSAAGAVRFPGYPTNAAQLSEDD